MIDKKLLTLSDIIPACELRRNPLAIKAEQEIEVLCRQYGILQEHFYEYNNIVSYMYPTASYDRLVISGLLFNALLYIDDVYEMANRTETSDEKVTKHRELINQQFENSMRLLVTGEMPDDDFFLYPIVAHLHQALASHADGKWIQRMVKTLVKHLNAVALDNSDIVIASKVDLNEYIKVRHIDSAMDPTMDMVEYMRDIYLPDEILADEHIESMRSLCARVGALMNDIFSYEKEVIQMGSRFNLIAIYMESHDLSFEEAVHYGVELVNESTRAFAILMEHVPDYGDAALQRDVLQYLRGLEDLGGSTWHWQIRTNRYRSDKSPYPELRKLLPEQQLLPIF